MIKTGTAGLALIEESEGLRLAAYQDSVGVWTIGWGHTKGVKEGDVCTRDEAVAFLMDDLKDAEHAIANLVIVMLTQNQYDALVSFIFNLGRGNFAASTLLRKINQSDFAGAAREFLKWDHAGGQVLAGLTKRRAAEAALFTKE